MPILYCESCRCGFASVGEVPTICPACEQPTKWRSSPLLGSPPVLKLTVTDKAYLREIKIDPDR